MKIVREYFGKWILNALIVSYPRTQKGAESLDPPLLRLQSRLPTRL